MQDLDPAARRALQGGVGARGPIGLPGPAGTPGVDGSALAYALVYEDGSFDQTRSKNVAAVKLVKGIPGSPGYYCIDVAPGIAIKNIVAMVDGASSGTVTGSITGDSSGACFSQGFDATVSTFGGSGPKRFNVVFN